MKTIILSLRTCFQLAFSYCYIVYFINKNKIFFKRKDILLFHLMGKTHHTAHMVCDLSFLLWISVHARKHLLLISSDHLVAHCQYRSSRAALLPSLPNHSHEFPCVLESIQESLIHLDGPHN